MRQTSKYKFNVPESAVDPDDVPTHLGNLADAVDALIGLPLHGTLSNRPVSTSGSPGIEGRIYYVDSGPGLGITWRDNGSGWDQLVPGAGVTSDVRTLGWGDLSSAGTPSKGFAPVDHDHGTPSNPITAHLAASNPHPQYAQTVRLAHTFALNGALVVASGASGYIPPFFVPVPTGQTAIVRAVRAMCRAGSCALTIQKNGAGLTGLIGIGVDNVAFTTAAGSTSDNQLADGDAIAPIITSVNFADGLSLSIFVDYL
jgi:hypothetical protein